MVNCSICAGWLRLLAGSPTIPPARAERHTHEEEIEMTAIKYPKNQDLRELVRFSCETGHIWLAESRMLMLHASAMALLRRRRT